MTQLGELSLWVALLMALWSVIVSFAGAITGRSEFVASATRGVHAVLVFGIIAAAALVLALLAHDDALRYVAAYTSANLASRYAAAALWAGREGTILVWTVMLAAAATAATLPARTSDRPSAPHAVAVFASVLALLLASVTLGAGPFDRLQWAVAEGRGMHPRLRHPGMLLQPPVLYAGLVLTAVPFARTLAALLTRQWTNESSAAARRWGVAAWVLVSAGVLLGFWWSYAEVQPGRGWFGPALADGAMLPWLALSAWLYTGTERQHQSVAQQWTVIFPILAFPLAAFAALNASGLLEVGRDLQEGQRTSAALTAIVSGALLAGGVLVAVRLPDLTPRPAATHGSGVSRRQYFWLLVYAGVLAMAAATVGSRFELRHELRLGAGETADATDAYGRPWHFASDGVSHYTAADRRVTAAVLAAYRSGALVGLLTSEQRQYVDSRGAPTFAPITVTGIASSPLQDVRATLFGTAEEDQLALIGVSFVPLVWLLWIGGALLIAGGALVSWPRTAERAAVRADAASADVDHP